MVESQTQESSAAAKLFERSICLVASFSRMGTRRKVSNSQIEAEADKSLLHVSKEILDSQDFRAVQKHDGETRNYLRGIALPSPMFKGGVSLIPIALVEQVDAYLQDRIAERDMLVQTAIKAYPGLIEKAQRRLGPLFDSRDYPPVDRVKAAFNLSTQYVVFNTPGTLKAISKSIFEREQAKAEKEISEATGAIIQVLTLNFQKLIEHMVERLTPEADGKQKIFRNSLVENMDEFLTTFKARVTVAGEDRQDVVELMTLADRAREVMKNVTPDALRDSTDIRQYVSNSMAKVKESLDLMVESRSRVRRDEDEEEVA